MQVAAWVTLTGVPEGWRGLLGSMEESQFHPESPQWDWGSLRWQKGPRLSCQGHGVDSLFCRREKQNKGGGHGELGLGLNSAGLEWGEELRL